MHRKPLSQRAQRVVRYTKVDGTKVERRFNAWVPPNDAPVTGDTVEALIAAWQRSPRWKKLAERSKISYNYGLLQLHGIAKAKVKDVTRRHLLAIRDYVIENHGMGSGKSFVCAIGSLFSFAVRYQWIDVSPASRMRDDLDLGELPAWTEAHYDLAVAHLPERLRRAVVLAVFTGQRSGDLRAMRWSDYDGTYIDVVQEKGGGKLRIRVIPELREELEVWRRESGGKGHILLAHSGLSWRGANLACQMTKFLNRIPGWPEHHSLHGVRKLAATNLARAGCNPHEIAAITGHKTLAMVAFYTKSIEQVVTGDAAMDKLIAWRGARSMVSRETACKMDLTKSLKPAEVAELKEH